MQAIGPIIGMLLLGAVAGWGLGHLCHKAVRFALLVIVVLVALELVGYHLASAHWDTIVHGAAGAANTAGERLRGSSGTFWALATYNLPFTIGFVWGLLKTIPRRRRR